jgi:hypothetical protein
MDKKQLLLSILLYLGAIVIVFVISYIALGRFLGIRPNIPFLSNLPLLPSATPMPPGGSEALKKAVVKTTLANGGYFYSINGRFGVAPYYQGEILRGEFVIDGDTTGTRIPVLMTSRTGNMNFGTFKGSYTGDSTWSLVPTDLVKASVTTAKPAQLRLVYQANQKLTEFDRTVINALDKMAAGTFSVPEQFVLIPVMVGVVQQ